MALGERFLESFLFIRHFAKWYVMSLVAGMVNVGAFLACGRFVTHVTGFGTLVGVHAARQTWMDAGVFAIVPIFFLAGSIIAAYMIERPVSLKQLPNYRLPLLLVAAELALAGIGSQLFHPVPFGSNVARAVWDFPFLALLCLASGTQNGLVTLITGGIVRTTHMTGTTTDIGIGLVRMLYPPEDLDKYESELRKLWLRLGTIIAYVVGSLLGGLIFVNCSYLGFLVPAAITLMVALFFI